VDPKRIKGYRITKYNPLLFGPAGQYMEGVRERRAWLRPRVRVRGRTAEQSECVRSRRRSLLSRVAVRRELGITPTLGGQDSPALEVPVVVVFDCEETG
jgi:hypothetical protein